MHILNSYRKIECCNKVLGWRCYVRLFCK